MSVNMCAPIQLYHDNEGRSNSSVKDTTICTLPEMKENKRGIFINVLTVEFKDNYLRVQVFT